MEKLINSYEVMLFGRTELIDVAEYPNQKFIGYFRSHDLIRRLNGLQGFGLTIDHDGVKNFNADTVFTRELAEATWKQIEKNIDNPVCQSVRNFATNNYHEVVL